MLPRMWSQPTVHEHRAEDRPRRDAAARADSARCVPTRPRSQPSASNVQAGMLPQSKMKRSSSVEAAPIAGLAGSERLRR